MCCVVSSFLVIASTPSCCYRPNFVHVICNALKNPICTRQITFYLWFLNALHRKNGTEEPKYRLADYVMTRRNKVCLICSCLHITLLFNCSVAVKTSADRLLIAFLQKLMFDGRIAMFGYEIFILKKPLF